MKTDGGIFGKIRNVLRPIRQSTRESRNRLLRRLGVLGGDWKTALPEELQFWERALRDPDRHWLRLEYDKRLDPELELQEPLKELIAAPSGSVVRILDVGAGPLTQLGKKWSARTLKLFPVDPLADEYRTLLKRLNIHPPVVTQLGHGERLQDQFEANYFDMSYASNSLDHSYDPLVAIEQMFAVTKPGCHVYLWHFAHVGVREGYAGLHQWNFDIKQEDVILSNGRGTTYQLSAVFRKRGELTCALDSFEGIPVVVCMLKKMKD